MLLFVRFLIRAYQCTISPALSWLGGPGTGCRFEPTCSRYALDAIEIHGVLKGSWLGLRRLGRCHPWGGQGYEPVPERKNVQPRKTLGAGSPASRPAANLCGCE